MVDADGVPALDAAGDPETVPTKSRVRIAAPVAGWMSEKQVVDLPAPRNPPDPRRPGP